MLNQYAPGDCVSFYIHQVFLHRTYKIEVNLNAMVKLKVFHPKMYPSYFYLLSLQQ